ncbi:Ribosomal protein S9/S16 [Musa troglodytarum]|uniref:Ribosomal protein S9/S16 n=1 Tax=Musa troglodytarum TaxID=320322 RepID=A0A9E7EKG4_9LILI|nr:Ribosomal protein S9/S16 [Musa troglodytarum]
MIDSLILLKDVSGVKGLPPLTEIEDKAIARLNEASPRVEVERKKQEEAAKARVRLVDEKGRAYGTGRRKCSIARVWIKPGDGKFIVNEKQFDTYFPILDHRAELLRPFTVTKTLGLWDVNCTAQGGGVSGQVGAIRLGISRALQNWEPGLRPFLKAALQCNLILIVLLMNPLLDLETDQHSSTIWLFDARPTCRRTEEAWKGQSQEELSMGQAITGVVLVHLLLSAIWYCWPLSDVISGSWISTLYSLIPLLVLKPVAQEI